MFCHYYDSIATIKFVDSKLEKKVIVRVDFVFVYCTGQKIGQQYSKKKYWYIHHFEEKRGQLFEN